MAGTQVDLYPDSFVGSTGSVGYLFPSSPNQVAGLFETPVEVAEGSVITVVEELFLELELTDESLVDLDTGWFGGRPYVGTYRLYGDEQALSTYTNPEAEGFLTSTNVYIKRETPYLVVSDLPGRAKEYGRVILDSCSLVLDPVSIAPGGNLNSSSNRAYQPRTSLSVLRGLVTGTLATLGTGRLKREIASVGLFLRPGIAFSTGRRITRIGNQVEAQRAVYTRVEDCTVGLSSCAELEAAFFSSGPVRFRTYNEAVEYARNISISEAEVAARIATIVSVTQNLGSGCLVQAYVFSGNDT